MPVWAISLPSNEATSGSSPLVPSTPPVVKALLPPLPSVYWRVLAMNSPVPLEKAPGAIAIAAGCSFRVPPPARMARV